MSDQKKKLLENIRAVNHLADLVQQGRWKELLQVTTPAEEQAEYPLYLRVEALRQLGRLAEAESAVHMLLARRENSLYLRDLAVLQARQGKNEAALKSINRALQIDPNDPDLGLEKLQRAIQNRLKES